MQIFCNMIDFPGKRIKVYLSVKEQKPLGRIANTKEESLSRFQSQDGWLYVPLRHSHWGHFFRRSGLATKALFQFY